MKKWLLILGMVTCLLGMTACGKDEASGSNAVSEEILASADQIVESINMLCTMGQEEQVAEDPIYSAAVESWKKASEDMGNYVKILEHSGTTNKDGAVIKVRVQGSQRNATVEVLVDDQNYLTSITTNVEYTMGERLEKAALNTVLGMGTVFSVLVLISLLIYCMRFIPALVDKFSGESKKEEPVRETEKAVDNTIAQIIEKEELSDDSELVAVIAAAIAAAEGAVSTEGFVVRSIRRSGRNGWQKA